MEIKSLVEKGALEICTVKPKFISPINVVPKKNNKYRLITNLKVLNGHIDRKTFRNEDIRTTIDLVKKEDKMISLDLKDCFYHLPVNPKFRDYLGIYFEKNVLPLVCSPIRTEFIPILLHKNHQANHRILKKRT